MGATLDETRIELAARRAELRATADRLEAKARRALDLKTMVRENPVKVAGVAAGIGFLLVGGPRHTLRAIRRAVRGTKDGERAYAALPASLRALVDASVAGGGQDREEARRQLALAFAAWREDPKNRKRGARLASETLTPPGPERAFWSVVELAATTGVAIVARQVVARWLAGELRHPRGPASHPPAAGTSGKATVTTDRYAGWSGQRATPAGPAKEPATPASGRSQPGRESP
ncbi:MAG: hypothetical protein ACRDFZ_00075 [Candidatus Limnocylindria bacterium]